MYRHYLGYELAKASPSNDCLAYEKPHKAILVFIPLG